MKRLFLPLLMTVVLALACPFSGNVGTGSQVTSLLSDPGVGLDALDNYRAVLTISFQGSQDGQPVNSSDTYLQNEWLALAAKFTTIEETNDSGSVQFTLAGMVGEARYYQVDSSGPCMVDWGASAVGSTDFRPAFLLPEVGSAKLAGEETVDGIATRHYTLDAASFSLPADSAAKGDIWLATNGGYVMKYVLDITGADSVFGPGAQGARHLEYLLSEVGTHPQVDYPAGCEPVLDLAAVEDATDLVRLPRLLAYNTNSASEAILAFYTDKLVALGWEKGSEVGQTADSALWTFKRTDTGAVAFVDVTAEGSSQRVTIMLSGQKSAAVVQETTPGAQSTAQAGNPSVRVVSSLNILLGNDSSHATLPSYHLESINRLPVWDGGKIAHRQDGMSAEVQGKDVHFIHTTTTPAGIVTTAEVYLIGDQEYDVLNGQVQPPGPSMKGLAWSTWPLDPTFILVTGSTDATAAGTEVLEGRTAEIYELSGTDSSLSGVSGIGLPVTAVSGKVWVDQETGALLKAVIDYQADVSDGSGTNQGSGTGHLEITVTQIGNVTVALP